MGVFSVCECGCDEFVFIGEFFQGFDDLPPFGITPPLFYRVSKGGNGVSCAMIITTLGPA